jgi:hypothetical protein
MVQISRKDLERLAIAFGIADFLSGGKLTAPVGNATRRAIVKAGPAIARGIVRYGPAAVGTAARVTPTGAVVSTAALLAIQNREKVAELAAQGYQVVAPAVQDYGQSVLERAMDPESYSVQGPSPQTMQLEKLGIIPSRPKKVRSKFNAAVKKGMQIVKGSTSYGKKGTINNAKKAFTAVTKAASAVNKGRKAPKSGIRKKLHTAMTKIIGKKKKTTKKKSKINIKVYKK